MSELFVRNPELNIRSNECEILSPEAFAAFSPATQEAYLRAAQDPKSPISDELRVAVLNATVEGPQE